MSVLVCSFPFIATFVFFLCIKKKVGSRDQTYFNNNIAQCSSECMNVRY